MAGGRQGVRVTVLVEDQRLDRFAREVLFALGFHRREVHVAPYPKSGRGSGKKWVEQNYLKLAASYRARRNSQQLAMVIGTDADELTAEQRAAQLDKVLKSNSGAARTTGEAIIYWIPRWSVETWLLHLSGAADIGEDTSYRHDPRVHSVVWNTIGAGYVNAYRAWRQEHDRTGLDSLDQSFRETNRLMA